LAEYLAVEFGGELLNSDASAVYRQLSIGVTKPDDATRGRIPYHLLDVTELERGFTLMDYIELANAAIDEISSRSRIPIVVGGSGLYARAVLDGYRPHQIEVSAEIRERVRATEPRQALAELQTIDPGAYQRIDRQNPRRVSRALELAVAAGGPVEPARACPRSDLDILRLILMPARELLNERIRRRTLQMWEGWVKEVDQLEKKGLTQWLDVRKPIGYDAVLAYTREEMSREQAMEQIVGQTTKLAKKQKTWLKREKTGPNRHWLELNHTDEWSELPDRASQLIRKFLS
jgi:tRNA dimethylallyltransferase